LRELARRGTYLDDDDVDAILGLSLPGVDELMGLLELLRLAQSEPADLVVVDTAPTGHALRLLRTPDTLRGIASIFDDMNAKHRLLVERFATRARVDAVESLIAEIAQEGVALTELLTDPGRTRFDWVLLPEALSLEESVDGLAALRREGVPIGDVIVNRITPPPPGPCALCDARRRSEAVVVAAARRRLSPGLRLVPAVQEEPRGSRALATIARALESNTVAVARSGAAPRRPRARPGTSSVSPVLDVICPREARLIVFAGKGGVGKTSCACVAALALARRDPARRILLLSVDPAHSLADALGSALSDTPRNVAGAPRNLYAREIDAQAAFARLRDSYRAGVERAFASWSRSGLDPAHDRALMAELIDLAPPGLDEVLALVSLVDALGGEAGQESAFDAVVLDSAPTGHALRVLAMPDVALEWVRAALRLFLKYRARADDFAAELVGASRRLRALHALLRDAALCRMVAVTRPAVLPRLETARLLRRLRGLQIPVAGLIANACTPPGCARCRRAAARETPELAALTRLTPASATAILAPLLAPPPQGAAALSTWGATWTRMVR
jgi:arsenite-transporting ATPase